MALLIGTQGVLRDQGSGGKDGKEPGDRDVFNQSDPISSKLQQVLFPFPGSISPLPSGSTDFEFTPLVWTGNKTGTASFRPPARPFRGTFVWPGKG